MLSTQKSPTMVETLASYNILSVASESLTFYTQAGAVDSGEAIGTIVIGKLAKAPILNLFGDRLGEFSGSAISTSISFTTGVLDSTLECGFIHSGSLNERITQTVAMLATKTNGSWACDYLTGLIIVKKKTTGTSQTINYKVRAPAPVIFDSSSVFINGVAVTPKFAFANVAASTTDSQVIPLVSGKKIRVLAVYAIAGGTATDLTFQSNSVAISAKFANGANGGEVLPFSPVGWFETVAGEALKVTTGAGSTTGLGVVYVEV